MSWFNLSIRGSASSFENRNKTPQILRSRWKLNNACAYFTTVSRAFETVSVDLAKAVCSAAWVLKCRKDRRQGRCRAWCHLLVGNLPQTQSRHQGCPLLRLASTKLCIKDPFGGCEEVLGVYKIEMGCWNLWCLLAPPRGTFMCS